MHPAAVIIVLAVAASPRAEMLRLESPALVVEIDSKTGGWSLLDKASGVRWPSEGAASPGLAKGLEGEVRKATKSASAVRLEKPGGAVVFELAGEGRSLVIRYQGEDLGELRVLEDALAVTDRESGQVIVPCRQGLLIPASSGVAFQQTFGTSDYEGCHMNMLGLLKSGSALLVTWDDAYVWAELQSAVSPTPPRTQRIRTALLLRRGVRGVSPGQRETTGKMPVPPVRLTPLGKGDWNTIAAGYRRIAEEKDLAVTLRQKIQREPHAQLLVGASNAKLWTCLARRMNEQSTKEESVHVHWTFDEAAAVAEHLKKDLGIDRALFMLGGWTEGGYDCRHPDNLPANPECGGNEALAEAIRRIQALGYVGCLHDNYQDMYRDAKSWNPAMIEKRPDGSLVQGGRWLGGRAFMVCAPKQVELAMRPQNLPGIQKLFGPWSYFIDTTYAVGPRECFDPDHPIGRNEDIAWKIKLSDEARRLFGLFGSECGREWALPHSDFFEGLVGVSGRSFHNLKPESLGATVIPFWEMVYHDCQICFGKYGYRADQAAAYVAHHVLCARPLHYHSFPDHRYWLEKPEAGKGAASGVRAAFTRTDQGWAEGLHPTDVFIKNTHEVLGPLHAATAHARLTRFQFLAPDQTLRKATYGEGDAATTVVVNFGAKDAETTSGYGGAVLLPPWGFVIDGPSFAAFCAKRWNGQEYADGALFTLRAEDGKTLREASRVRVFHGFGEPKISWGGATHEVRRERVIGAGRPS
ncbi:MAG: DUF5696 domain-containing protein [Thermoguttaceae bacterium]